MVQRIHLAAGFNITDCCAGEVLKGERATQSLDKYPTVDGDTTTFTHHHDLEKSSPTSTPTAQPQHPTDQKGAVQYKLHGIVPGKNAGLGTIPLQT